METITLTFGEQAENHKGMEILGSGLAAKGFTQTELEDVKSKFEESKAGSTECELIDLGDDACVLVVRNGASVLLDGGKVSELFQEQRQLDWDKKAFMYGRVVNKNARHNLCFGKEDREPDYENKKGRIVAFPKLLSKVKANLGKFFGRKAENLQCEGNYYYDVRKCGIGYHGDTERKIVIGVRLGATIPLVFRWYQDSKRVGDPVEIKLNSGDVYAMSEKATGFDWKKKKILTLRHAAGCRKFIV